VAAPGYVVDLRPVTFIDSAGLNVVLRLRRRVTGTGSGFALVCDTAQLRLLRANGTADVLNPSATLAEAVSGLLPLRDGPLPARSGPNRSARGPAAG
jgi:anti-anti-sigma regulatory factor